MICISETYSNRFNSDKPLRVTVRTVDERGPEWERRYDRDVFHSYFDSERAAERALKSIAA